MAAADYELKKKSEKTLTKKTKISFYPYLYAVAAVLVVATSLTAYNALKPQDTTDNAIVAQSGNDKIVISENSIPKKEEITKNTLKEENKVALEQNNVPVKSNKKITEDSLESAKEEQKAVTILFNVNHIKNDDTALKSRSAPLIVSDISQNEEELINHSIYEELSKEQYESYIGFSPEKAVIVPDDMTLFPKEDFSIEKNLETGEIINDENTYYFENSFERFMMIATTKKTNEIDSFLNDETYQKSVINDNNFVITLNEGIYNAYLKRNDIGIKITAGKIEEKELENTIKSLLE